MVYSSVTFVGREKSVIFGLLGPTIGGRILARNVGNYLQVHKASHDRIFDHSLKNDSKTNVTALTWIFTVRLQIVCFSSGNFQIIFNQTEGQLQNTYIPFGRLTATFPKRWTVGFTYATTTTPKFHSQNHINVATNSNRSAHITIAPYSNQNLHPMPLVTLRLSSLASESNNVRTAPGSITMRLCVYPPCQWTVRSRIEIRCSSFLSVHFHLSFPS